MVWQKLGTKRNLHLSKLIDQFFLPKARNMQGHKRICFKRTDWHIEFHNGARNFLDDYICFFYFSAISNYVFCDIQCLNGLFGNWLSEKWVFFNNKCDMIFLAPMWVSFCVVSHSCWSNKMAKICIIMCGEKNITIIIL